LDLNIEHLATSLTVVVLVMPLGCQRHYQGGHKPGILRDFSEHGKLREFCATSGKNYDK